MTTVGILAARVSPNESRLRSKGQISLKMAFMVREVVKRPLTIGTVGSSSISASQRRLKDLLLLGNHMLRMVFGLQSKRPTAHGRLFLQKMTFCPTQVEPAAGAVV